MKSIPYVPAAILVAIAVSTARAQYGPVTRYEPYPLHSGWQENTGAMAEVMYREVVEFPGTPWMRLHFGESNLGQESLLILTSLKDGAEQRFQSNSLRQWDDTSADFTGESVRIELIVAPGERDIYITVEGMTISDEPGSDPDPDQISLCDDDDDRVPSSDPRVGRLRDSGCTGWLIGNGTVLTAGHCTASGTITGVLEFNVPPSQPNGTIMPASPNDQYPVVSSSLVFENDGEGHDFAVFMVNTNSTTGLTAHEAQGFFKVTTVVPEVSSTLRVTGHGLDNQPPGSGGPGAACCDTNGDMICEGDCNSASKTQQTDTGRLDALDDTVIDHEVDTMPGNSGSPIIDAGNAFTIGIHTHGGCDTIGSDFDNAGTWFGYSELFDAINGFTAPGTIFVDADTPDSSETGSVLRPFDTVAEAVAGVPSGGVIRIFAGTYNIAAGNTLFAGEDGRAMRLEPLLGTAIIGN